jgi:hypothetical protein
MVTKLNNIFIWFADKISMLSEPKATMSAGEITRLSWARHIENIDALPEIYHDEMIEIIHDGHEFPFTVVTPTFEGFLWREREKVIFNIDRKIFIFEHAHGKIIKKVFNLENIAAIELGQVLLKAWMKIDAVSEQGEKISSVLRFNAVTTRLFEPFIDIMRCSHSDWSNIDPEKEKAKFSELSSIDFKFMNFAKRSLQPDEKVQNYLYQPEVRTAIIKLNKKSILSHSLCLSHMVILTDHELILVEDDPESEKYSVGTRYGGIWTYIPLQSIRETSQKLEKNGLIYLCLSLIGDFKINLPFEPFQMIKLDNFEKTLISSLSSSRILNLV